MTHFHHKIPNITPLLLITLLLLLTTPTNTQNNLNLTPSKNTVSPPKNDLAPSPKSNDLQPNAQDRASNEASVKASDEIMMPVKPPQEANYIYSSSSMATAVILTFLFTVFALAAFYWWWNRRKALINKERHLILETDPEKGGKSEFAFDNPGFKDATLIATSEKSPKLESKHKWTHWSPLSALTLTRTDKKRALDDSQIEQSREVKVVALKSHDFTGLGFSICGNMKDGIYIKDILHRGPAFESGKLNTGDRINSVTISFEHMVYEDALTILSYASPYEVMIEARSGRIHASYQGHGHPNHPVYRRCSHSDLYNMEKSSKKKLFTDDYSSGSNYSSLQKSRSNMTTLERKESKSPKMKKQDRSPQKLTPDLLKTHFEEKVTIESSKIKENVQKFENELQKTENKPQKFGIRVLPTENMDKSPKIKEQNQNNLNIEKNMEDTTKTTQRMSIDEVDKKMTPPQPRKREKKSPETNFERNDSNIKRDKNGIPMEMPEFMMGAAVAAKRNRKNSTEGLVDDEDYLQGKKAKARAPHPPLDKFEDTQSVGESRSLHSQDSEDGNTKSDRSKFLVSDSEDERALSSVNTIELNSSDITIHQNEDEEKRAARKTASTGDLSKMNKKITNNGTLERAQSLDNAETNTNTNNLVKKRIFDETENLLIDREPRLSLILDGLNTFQRNRLKKSTEWGNLEDAILSLSQKNGEWERRRKSEPHFNAVMDRVKQIKRESQEIDIPESVVLKYQENGIDVDETVAPKVKNQIWPSEIDEEIEPKWKKPPKKDNTPKKATPIAPERNSLKNLEKMEQALTQSLDKDIESFSDRKYDLSPKKNEKSKFNVRSKAALFDNKADEDIKSVGGLKRADPSMALNFDPDDGLEQTSASSKTPFTLDFEKPCESDKKRTKVDAELLMEYYNDGIYPLNIVESEMLVKPEPVPLNKDPECQKNMIKDEWELAEENSLNNVSPPPSLTLVDEVMDTYNKNQVEQEEPSVEIVSNLSDETKSTSEAKHATETFLSQEKLHYENNTNISDDIKVSRSSLESVELKKSDLEVETPDSPSKLSKIEFDFRPKVVEKESHVFKPKIAQIEPKSDDLKANKLVSVSQVTVTENGGSNLHSLELSINEPSELYTTALERSLNHDMRNTNSNEVGIVENSFSKVCEKPSLKNGNDFEIDILENEYSKFDVITPKLSQNTVESPIRISQKNPIENSAQFDNSDTYVTEIQVTNTTNGGNGSNISEIEVVSNGDQLENAFENYVKNFESKLENFESNMQNFENKLEEFVREEPKSLIFEEEKSDIEKQVSKIQEIAEEQLKRLPEMRFTTSSYESQGGRKTPEKRHSFELLRSNFEKVNDKSPPKTQTTPPRSRIPIATTLKTPPMSPERRDSRNLENENDRAILELMSSSVHSTPFTSKIKPPTPTRSLSETEFTSKIKPPTPTKNLSEIEFHSKLKSPSTSIKNLTELEFTSRIKPPSTPTKNVTVTSIRNNSKIPSGLPTLSGRPPIAPRKSEEGLNGESSFKQWVFNPNNVTNVSVGKDK